jgi:hypothetical protein
MLLVRIRDRLPARSVPAAYLQDDEDPSPAPFVHGTVTVMSFGIYIAGIIIVIGGLIFGAAILHAPVHWIVVGALVLLGFGILTGVKATRQKDPTA